MRIAILGWGSLIYDSRELPLSGGWERGGPTFPIEFSRLSGRKGTKPPNRLTLVIDEQCGTKVPTRFAYSADNDVPTARRSLQLREGASSIDSIASIDLVANVYSAVESQPISNLVTRWAKGNSIDGVVWTALPPNFLETVQKPYSWEAAFAFLETLSEGDKKNAFDYIRKAPEEVRTPFRIEFDKRYPA